MAHSNNNIYTSTIGQICKDIDSSYKNNVYSGCVILILCGIDAMAALAMPISQKNITSKYFMEWVGKYMRTAADQSYQYDPIDIWGARCGIVHRYSAKSDISDKNKCKIFVYHDGSDHIFNPKVNNKLVVISILRLKEDFKKAVCKYMRAALADPYFKKCMNSRIESLFMAVPAP